MSDEFQEIKCRVEWHVLSQPVGQFNENTGPAVLLGVVTKESKVQQLLLDNGFTTGHPAHMGTTWSKDHGYTVALKIRKLIELELSV